MKFGALLGRARHLYDCEAVATGHYARRDVGADGHARLLRARDADKDQTYFLYGLRQDQLEHARFPLGELTKPEVRAVARVAGPRDGRQAREPGDLLRARRRLPRRAARARRLAPEAGPLLDARRRARWGSTAGRRPTPSASGRASAWRSASRATVSRIDPLTNTIHARAARGPRDDDDRVERDLVRRPATRRTRTRRSAPRSGSATARRRSRRPSDRHDR